VILRRNSNKEYLKKQKYKFQAKHGTTFGMSHRGAPSHTVDHTSAQNVLSFNCKTKGRCSTAQIAIAQKNWPTQKCQRQADVKKKIKNYLPYVYWKLFLSSFTFRQKINDCSNCNWSTKVLKNVNCSTQFIVKKMVNMYVG